MARYIEYDIASGHIISELNAAKPPELSDGTALLELDNDCSIEISRYIVKDGQLVKIHETNTEKDEQERIRQEYSASVRLRVKSIINEFCLALLEEDDEEITRLRKEYKHLRAYL